MRVSWIALGLVCWLSLVEAATYSYGAVIDAGSSGSRISVYRWPSRVFKTLPPGLSEPIVQTVIPKSMSSVTPGVNKAEGRDALKAMLTNVQPVLTKAGITVATTPIWLKATAGLRILTASEREATLAAVRDILSASGFLFKTTEWARVISGEEEGVFGWITANYWHNTLTGAASKTVGALDMGGASTQITFSPHEETLANLYNLKLSSEVDVNLYTHSFLYYGQDQFRYRTNALIIDTAMQNAGADDAVVDARPPATLPNPCFNSGAPNVSYNHTSFTGTSSFTACQSVMKQLLYRSTVCLTDPGFPTGNPTTCSINGVYQPRLDSDQVFYAFSGYSYLYDFLGLKPDVTVRELQSAVSASCALSYAELKKKHPTEKDKYLVNYCASGVQIVTLLNIAYGIGLDDVGRLYVVPVDDPHAYSYALGGMLSDANSLQWRYDGDDGSKPFKLPLIIVACVAGLALLAVLVLVVKARNSNKDFNSFGDEPLTQGYYGEP